MAKAKSKKLLDQATELADRVAPHVEHARQKAAPLVSEARKTAGPALTEARDKLTTEVLPVLTAAIAAANEATEDVRGEAVKRGRATAAALKGEVEAPKKKRRHRLRRLLVALGLSGVAAMIAKKLSDRQATSAWQSSYTPTPAPTASTSSMGSSTGSTSGPSGMHMAETTDDVGGASPDVAAADAAAEPRTPTTPDDPLQQDDINKTD
jgi:F0F1-type ATP synthase membrane subunit b/b'